jgi:NAD(P)-dependent dehydrogenase (short-subunit alcohol dehydrogenase family)
VTGANQGLGFALTEGERVKRGDVVYLTGRDSVRVRAAAECIAGPRAEVHSGQLVQFEEVIPWR